MKQNNDNIYYMCKKIYLLKDEKIIETFKNIFLELKDDEKNNYGILYKTNIRLI